MGLDNKQKELEAIQLIQKSEMLSICDHGITLCELIATKKLFVTVMKKIMDLGDGNPKITEGLATLSKLIVEADAELLVHRKHEQKLKDSLSEKQHLFEMGSVLNDLMKRRS